MIVCYCESAAITVISTLTPTVSSHLVVNLLYVLVQTFIVRCLLSGCHDQLILVTSVVK